jgi:hypothetical protein
MEEEEKKEEEGHQRPSGAASVLVKKGVRDITETVERERKLDEGQKGELRQRTRWNVRKALQYRSTEDVKRFEVKVKEHIVCFFCFVFPQSYSPPPSVTTIATPPPLSLFVFGILTIAIRTHSLRGRWR